jgi:hypothetical protein
MLFDNVRNQKKFLSTIICVDGNTLTRLTKFLQGSYQRKAVDGKTGGWFMIHVRAWHQDCKDLFLY